MNNDGVKELPWTGERLVPTCRGQVLYEHLHRYALAVALAPGKRVLDIACGEGYGSNLLAGVSKHVIGVDIASEVIAHAKHAYHKKNLLFREGSCLNIPVEDRSVDLVVSFETIEHLDDHEQFLREIKRVLSDGGTLIISSPDKQEYTDRLGNKNPFHRLELSHADFRRLLKRHFKKCQLGKQRLVVGSWIAPDAFSTTNSFGTFSGDIHGVNFRPGVPRGIYSIALCSDVRLPRFRLGVFENTRESDNTWASLERSSSTPTIQVFCDYGAGFLEASSMTAALRPNRWQTIRFENLERLSIESPLKPREYRIDPIDRPACLTISKILIARQSDGSRIYSANSPGEFDQIRCSSALLKHVDEQGLFLIATDSDPQLYLPQITQASSDPCFLEVTLQVTLDPGSALTRYHRTVKNESQLTERLAELTLTLSTVRAKEIETLARQRDEFRERAEKADVEIQSLQSAAQTQGTEIATLGAERDQIDGTLKDLQIANQRQGTLIHDLENSLEAERFHSTTKNSQNVELGAKLASFEQQISDFTHIVGLSRKGLQRPDSQAAIIIRSLSREIRRIRKKARFWNLVRSVSRVKESPGAKKTDPRATARRLKEQLQELQRTLKSKKTSPVMALDAFAKIVILQRRAEAALRSLSGSRLFRTEQTEQTEHPDSASDSELRAALQSLFDPVWYTRLHREAAATGISPFQFYLDHGIKKGHDPHPLFDVRWYLSQRPEIRDPNINPLEHYVLYGALEGRSPHPQFDSGFYIKNYPDSIRSGMNPLRHYLTIGWELGYRPNPHFDPTFYLRNYGDVAAAKIEPLTHFVLSGQVEGRKTSEGDSPFQLYELGLNIPSDPAPKAAPIVPRVKAIAFYLPQFHPIPENDLWWGEGFTEWDNVRAGRPNYPGQYQPHVPIGLGYYDLRTPEVLQKQTELAKAYGLFGFCFYYYWFDGKVLLDLPIRRMLNSGQPDFPFCICWANENWTRKWDGRERDILISQNHSPEDDLNFIRSIEKVLLQNNYIRVQGKPLLLVYRPSLFPNPRETANRWREYFLHQGHGELHLTMVRSFHDKTPPQTYGFDASVQFPPHFPTVPITSWVASDEGFIGDIHDYAQLRRTALEELVARSSDSPTYPAVMPSWDNTARRRQKAVIWANSSPEAYYAWLKASADYLETHRDPNEDFVFINAWNEWAEGCHLEPDEKYRYAWLNATAMALRQPTPSLPARPSIASAPPLPTPEVITIARLPHPVKLAISVLFYHREDLIPSFLRSILAQIRAAESQGDIQCTLNLAFNYQPPASVSSDIQHILAEESCPSEKVNIFQNDFNLGFGAGHNSVFEKSTSDIFLILNSDVQVKRDDWLVELVKEFRDSDAAIVGLTETASRLREDGCGILIESPAEQFDFVDGSVLAIRSALVPRFGLFSPSYDYFYFEDADLCLRYRQIGLQIRLLDVPHEHKRSSSSQLLPQFAIEGVLNRNRARFFERWGSYLRTRRLPNRIGLRFLGTNRQLQCASLPGIFALLAEHPTAVIDLQGVHEQLVSLFEHSRIRLIPSWQDLSPGDYLRYCEVPPERSERPQAYSVAQRLGCEPDFEGARGHLQSLIFPIVAKNSASGKRALVYVERNSPLFDGKQPSTEGFAAIAPMLRTKDFAVTFFTNFGVFEIQHIGHFEKLDCHSSALLRATDLLREIATSHLLVTSDSWIAVLGQLLQIRTFVWLGAVACGAAIWDYEHAGCFADRSLDCLGCYHRFGGNDCNTCLRGDVACMGHELAAPFCDALARFIDGHSATAAEMRVNGNLGRWHGEMPSTHLSLDDWPRSAAASVLVLIPVGSFLDSATVTHAKELAHKATAGMKHSRIIVDDRGQAPVRGNAHPYRQSALAALRRDMIEHYLRDEQWVFWVDADIVDYPSCLVEELIQRAEGGVAAPLVLMEGDASEPARQDGFGPGRFYDVAGFVEEGRWARFTLPYFNQTGPIFNLDSVGSCYLINADIYRNGAAHVIDPASDKFVQTSRTWPKDAIARNQQGPANAFTEHYSVCQFALRQGLPVRAFADLIARHQRV
jgi:SAM-dependent methyltransferase/GT2 family glycosyltransferase